MFAGISARAAALDSERVNDFRGEADFLSRHFSKYLLAFKAALYTLILSPWHFVNTNSLIPR